MHGAAAGAARRRRRCSAARSRSTPSRSSRGDRRQGRDRRHRTSRLGVSRRADRDGARAAGDALHGLRAARRAARADDDADATRRAAGRRRTGTMATMALKASPHVSWQRTARGGVYAMGGVRRADRRVHGDARVRHRAAGSLIAAGKLNQRDVVLIVRLRREPRRLERRPRRRGRRPRESGHRAITLFNPTRVAARCAACSRALGPRRSRARAPDRAREGVKAIVDGDVTGLGSGFVDRAAARVRGLGHRTGLVSDDRRWSEATLVNGVDDVTRKLRGKIGESLKSVQASPPLEQVTTASFDALKAYTEGARAFDIEHDFAQSDSAPAPGRDDRHGVRHGVAQARRRRLEHTGSPQSAVRFGDHARRISFAPGCRRTSATSPRLLLRRGPGHDRQRAIAAYQALIDRGDCAYAANNLGDRLTPACATTRRPSRLSHVDASVAGQHDPASQSVNVLIDQGKRSRGRHVPDDQEAKRLPNARQYAYHLAVVPYSDGLFDRAEHVIDSIHSASKSLDTHAMASYVSSELLAVRGRLAEPSVRYRRKRRRRRR